MTRGRAPTHEDMYRSTRERCESRLPERSTFRLLAAKAHELFPDDAFADLFTATGRASIAPRIVAVVMVLQRYSGLTKLSARQPAALRSTAIALTAPQTWSSTSKRPAPRPTSRCSLPPRRKDTSRRTPSPSTPRRRRSPVPTVCACSYDFTRTAPAPRNSFALLAAAVNLAPLAALRVHLAYAMARAET